MSEIVSEIDHRPQKLLVEDHEDQVNLDTISSLLGLEIPGVL